MLRKNVTIPAGHAVLEGELVLPQDARVVVLFAHGSGSSRFSPRNTYVASVLQQENIGTLLFDLLTREGDSMAPAESCPAIFRHRLLRRQHRCSGSSTGRSRNG